MRKPGTKVGRFEIEKKLGEGGMASVYLAKDLTLFRTAALKVLEQNKVLRALTLNERENLKNRFVREAQTAALINHPNITQIYDANFDSDSWYIAMEYIDGDTLNGLLKNGYTFSLDEILSLLYQVASGLKYAWDKFHIIHRDINPMNIMVNEDGDIKIVDLGLAKPVVITDLTNDCSSKLTMPGTPVGTPWYMAPEQATGIEDIDHRADIYSLGATMYELCTGQRAFSGKTTFNIYKQQMMEEYQPIEQFRDDCSVDFTTLDDNMLKPDRNHRVDNYEDILNTSQTLLKEF